LILHVTENITLETETNNAREENFLIIHYQAMLFFWYPLSDTILESPDFAPI